MAFIGDEIDPKTLLEEAKRMLSGNTDSAPPMAQPESINTGGITSYQAPIKSTWYNSGGFDASGALRPNGRRGHGGVDMRTQAGTPVYPMAPGTVTNVGTDPLGGNVVNVQHAGGVRTYYAHLSTAKVHKGDKVDNNTVLGTVGQTGNAKGTVPHLHFQVWSNEQLQDPAKYFSIPKYTNIQPEEKQKGLWVSDQAQREAANFNMAEHNQNKRLAFSQKADQLLKQADQFYKLVSGQSKNRQY